MTPQQSQRERTLIGIGLLAFLGVLAYGAARSNNRFTVIVEIVSAALLLSGIGLGWWRRRRGDRSGPEDG